MVGNTIPDQELQVADPPKKLNPLKCFILIALTISTPSFFTYLAFININKPRSLFELIAIWLYIFIFISSVASLLVFPNLRLKLQANRFLQVSSFIVLTFIAINAISLIVEGFYPYLDKIPRTKIENLYTNSSLGYTLNLFPSDNEWRIQEIQYSVWLSRLRSKGDYRLTIQKIETPIETLEELVEEQTKLVKEELENRKKQGMDTRQWEEIKRKNVSADSWQGIRIDYADCCGGLSGYEGLGHIEVYLQNKDNFYKITFFYSLRYSEHFNKEVNRENALKNFDLMIESINFNN